MTDIIRRDPLRNIFGWPQWFDDSDLLPAGLSQRGLKIHETDKDLVAEAVVAGIPAKDVNVEIEDGVLTIKAETKQEEKAKDSYLSSSYKYYYTVALSGGQWDKADAEVQNGVVTVTIPKTEAARPHKLTIKTKEK